MNDQLSAESKEKIWGAVYKHIRQNLLEHKYKPDETLSEISIAKELGVSRTPVSMAFNILEKEGLIVNHKGKKNIYRLTSDELIELFDAKISLQCSSVKLAIERKTKEEEDRLKEIIRKIEIFLESDFSSDGINPELNSIWEDLDDNFHIVLYEMSKSSYITRLIEDCDIRWTRIRSGVTAIGNRTRQNAEEHIILGKMILNNNIKEAEDYMKHHLQNILQTVLHLMEIF